MMGNSHRTGIAGNRPELTGPVIFGLTAESTPLIARMDARWAAVVLAGQAIDYAVTPEPSAALAEVLRMTGLVAEPASPSRTDGRTA